MTVTPTKSPPSNSVTQNPPAKNETAPIDTSLNVVQSPKGSTGSSSSSQARRRGHRRRGSTTSAKSSDYSSKIVAGSDDEVDYRKLQPRPEREEDWGIGDDMKMGLG